MERNALNELARILDALSIRWALIGALAANRYRNSPRLTQDVDLLLANRGPDGALLAALTASGWTVRSATAEGDLLRLRHAEFGAADVLIAGTEYQQLALMRARTESMLGGQAVPVLTVEDVIIHKLIAARSQDIADVEAIIAARAPLDAGYLQQWLAFWEVSELWAKLQRG